VPPAPGRFSTTNCWPVDSLIAFTTARVSTSLTPAGGHGTTTLTGLAGYDCADTAPAISQKRIPSKCR